MDLQRVLDRGITSLSVVLMHSYTYVRTRYSVGVATEGLGHVGVATEGLGRVDERESDMRGSIVCMHGD